MKVSMLMFFALLSSHSFSASANINCADLSGKYHSSWDTEESKTTIIINQTKCDRLQISGFEISKYPPYSTNYGILSCKLDGTYCKNSGLVGAVPGSEAAYQAGADFIIKTYTQMDIAADSIHGACTFKLSHLRKDKNGNLIEEPQDASCEDNFKGSIEPIIFSKAD